MGLNCFLVLVDIVLMLFRFNSFPVAVGVSSKWFHSPERDGFGELGQDAMEEGQRCVSWPARAEAPPLSTARRTGRLMDEGGRIGR